MLLGNLESSGMDPNLRLLLKNNIVLSWGDNLFWDKLRCSLPDLQTASPQSPPASVYSQYSTYRPHHPAAFNKNLHGQVNAALHI